MCTCKQEKKEHLGSGNFKYTFKCIMDNGSIKRVKATSGNDEEAKMLAELECNDRNSKFITHRNETLLNNNFKFVVEFLSNSEGNETIKTFLLDEDNNVLPRSTTVTCTVGGISVTGTCSGDGNCGLEGDTPVVICS